MLLVAWCDPWGGSDSVCSGVRDVVRAVSSYESSF